MQSWFLGVCLLISSANIAGAIIFALKPIPESINGRYQFQPSNPPGVIWILDTQTGEVKTQPG